MLCKSSTISSAHGSMVTELLHHFVGNSMLNENGIQHGITLLKDSLNMLNVDYNFELKRTILGKFSHGFNCVDHFSH